MFHELMPAVICLGLAYAVYKLVELFARRKERMELINKIDFKNGITFPADIVNCLTPPAPSKGAFTALRLGLLLTGIGFGVGLAIIMRYYMMDIDRDTLYFAMMMLFGGLGLVVAFLVEPKAKK